LHVVQRNEEEEMRKGILLAIGGLAFLSGCGNQQDKASKVPVEPGWKGASYHLAFDTKAAKPNPSDVTIPAIMYTANPDALEKRALLVVRIDTSGVTKSGLMDQMIMPPVDIAGAEGTLPAEYMNLADKDLSRLLGAYCIKGKVKISVALARSSLAPLASDAEVDAKRMSDWMPIEVVFKNPHPKC
jgi:hypothetical protein